MILLFALSLLACAPEEEQEPVDVGDPAPTLDVPDLSDVDLEQAYQDALRLALASTTSPAWSGHVDALTLARSGCPDFFAGAPDEDADIDEDAGGVSWSDYCETDGGLFYAGWAWWEADILFSAEVDGEEGSAFEASRTLLGDGVVGDSAGELFAFEGEATDATASEETATYSRWTWSSVVSGTLAGSNLFGDAETPQGWRADMSLYATGGDTSSVDITGDVFFFTVVLQDRFDSVSLNLSWTPPEQTSPDACSLEPTGYISVRDEDAFWYDLVFQPTEDDDLTGEGYADDPYLACDGCGTLYVRGIAQDVTVCPDFSAIWTALTPPTAEDYILTLRDLEAP